MTLKIGWTDEPDNLNPFIGYQTTTYEIWPLNYDFLFGFDDQQPADARPGERSPDQANGGISADGKIWTINIRPGVKWQDGAAAHRRRRGLHLQLHRQERHGEPAPTTPSASRRQGARPDHRADRLLAAQGRHGEHGGCRSCPSTSGRTSRRRRPRTTYANKPPIVGSGPFQVVGFKKGSYIQMVRNPNYWGSKPAIDQSLLPDLPERRHHGRRPEVGQHRRRLGHARRPQFARSSRCAAFTGDRLRLLQLGLPRASTATQARARLGNPVLRDCKFRSALNYAIDKQQAGSSSPTTATPQPATTIIPPDTWTEPRLPLAAAGRARPTPSTWPRPSQMLTQAGYPLQRTACGSTSRASRSSCACTPRPTARQRARSRPS